MPWRPVAGLLRWFPDRRELHLRHAAVRWSPNRVRARSPEPVGMLSAGTISRRMTEQARQWQSLSGTLARREWKTAMQGQRCHQTILSVYPLVPWLPDLDPCRWQRRDRTGVNPCASGRESGEHRWLKKGFSTEMHTWSSRQRNRQCESASGYPRHKRHCVVVCMRRKDRDYGNSRYCY